MGYWNWDATPGTLTVKDMPGPTCASCHMSSFGGTSGTHNVGQRLKWDMRPEQAELNQEWETKRTNMKTICTNCHNSEFYNDHFEEADEFIKLTDENILEGKEIIDSLREDGIIDDQPLNEPIEYKYFELWHHEGRRARNGAIMAGPDSPSGMVFMKSKSM